MLIWVYGKEGNEFYVSFVKAVRAVTTRLPHAALAALCSALNLLVDVYIFACRWLPLPMRDYMRGTLARVSREQRKLTIYDQLNPTYARYYTGARGEGAARAGGAHRCASCTTGGVTAGLQWVSGLLDKPGRGLGTQGM